MIMRCARPGGGYVGMMDIDDLSGRPRWTDTARSRLPYVIGGLGLLAWFALLYFMLRDVL